jgi:rhamnosyltransferase subunit B
MLCHLAGGQPRAELIKKLGVALHSLCCKHKIATSAVIARPDITVALFSPYLVDRAAVKTGRAQIVGFPTYRATAAELPRRLVEFLAAGSPPIVFALGTAVVHGVDREFYDVAVSAAKRLGCRAVLLTGLGTAARNIPSDAAVLSTEEYVNYEALFQKARLVVHHGGIGTMAVALRAGVPTLIVPFAFDQAHNALVAQQRGIARALALQDYGVDTLVSELSALIHDPVYAARTKELGSLVRNENGAEKACQIIEQLYERAAPSFGGLAQR